MRACESITVDIHTKSNELLYTRNLITTVKIIMCGKTLMCEITKTSMLCSSCCYQLPNCLLASAGQLEGHSVTYDGKNKALTLTTLAGVAL